MGRHVEHRIAPGVRGWLENPNPDALTQDCLIVSGWAFAHGSKIAEIWAEGPGFRRPLSHGLPRHDVARVYADEPNAANSGFSGYLELDGHLRSAMALEVSATLDDGRSIRLFRRVIVSARAARKQSRLRWAVRQVAERPRVLLSFRAWLSAFGVLRNWWASGSRRASGPVDAAAAADRARLSSFLESGRLTFTASTQPLVSAIVVVWNRAELTLKCLEALAAQTNIELEVIIVDNASSDETVGLLARLTGVTVVRNHANVGFTVGANLGAKSARGELLLFLNNDAVLEQDAVRELADTARRSSTTGAVGGKLVFPDGRLQEAGSIVWSDGSCDAYGRGGDPSAPEVNFERRVDFCSGAMLLTRRAIFESLGGFDERYRPAYYEDADYCARLWSAGFPVVYQPKAVAVHAEFGSAASAEAAVDLQRARRPIFVSRHNRWLSSQSARADGWLMARSHPHRQPSMLLIEDAEPDPAAGAGFPRSAALVDALRDLGFLVTIYATDQYTPRRPGARLSAVEVIPGGPQGLRAFLSSRAEFQAVIVSRPHNMQYLKTAVGSDLSALGMPCMYDAEAIYALREIGRRELSGSPIAKAECDRLIDAELKLTRGCAAVLAVSERERELFAAAAAPNVSVLAHAVDALSTPNAFARRRSILFVGAFGADSPNEDAAVHFCRNILPALRAIGCAAPVVIAGAAIPERLKAAADPSVSWHSDVGDLTPFYDDARIFVAPTRYAAGIPLKVVEAAARGVPIVATPLVAQQLGWRTGDELQIASNPAEFASAVAALYDDEHRWARLRELALQRVRREYSAAAFRAALQRAIEAATRSSAGRAPRTSLA